jgi:uncharacterized protein (TIGR03435 family)
MKAGSTSIEMGADSWNARGYDVKSLIAEIHDIDVRRIDFPADATADARYDVTLSLPKEVDADVMQKLLEGALEQKFRLSITPETRSMDVYVLTAPNGPGAALHRHASAQHSGKAALMALESRDGTDDEERITVVGRDCGGVASGSGIEASAGTMQELGRTLEPGLDRLLIDETHLAGSYDFKVGSYDNKESLFRLLQDQLGIVVISAQRKVTMLAVRPEQNLQAQL